MTREKIKNKVENLLNQGYCAELIYDTFTMKLNKIDDFNGFLKALESYEDFLMVVNKKTTSLFKGLRRVRGVKR